MTHDEAWQPAFAQTGGSPVRGLAFAATGIGPVAATGGRLRIAKQFGVVYLLLNVAEDQKLIEKHGKAAGVDIKVEYIQLSGGAAVNDALLSGNIEIASAGVGPLFTLWDRIHGRQNVKGVASLGNFPYYLVTNNLNVRTIADFGEKDRIACPPSASRCRRASCNGLRPSSAATRNSPPCAAGAWRVRRPLRRCRSRSFSSTLSCRS